MRDQEILVKLQTVVDSVDQNGMRMVRMAHEVATPSKIHIQADVLTAIEWINQEVDNLFYRAAKLLSARSDQRSELLLEQLIEEAESIEKRLELLKLRITTS